MGLGYELITLGMWTSIVPVRHPTIGGSWSLRKWNLNYNIRRPQPHSGIANFAGWTLHCWWNLCSLSEASFAGLGHQSLFEGLVTNLASPLAMYLLAIVRSIESRVIFDNPRSFPPQGKLSWWRGDVVLSMGVFPTGVALRGLRPWIYNLGR